MIDLTKLALKRPVSIIMIVLALLIFGGSSILSTPLELIPDIEMPMLIVMSVYPGAAPQDVDTLVTQHVEDAVSTLAGVKNVQSISSENMSMVVLEMEYGTNMERAHNDLKNSLDMYKMLLPDEVDTPTVVEMNVNTMMPTIVLSALPEGDIDLLTYVKEQIQPEFEKLGGVATVQSYGGKSDYISVELMEDKLAQYGLTMDTLASVIKSADFSMPAGSIAQGNLDLTLRGGVSYRSAEALRAIPLTLKSGDIIHLSDIARVYQATEPAASISRYNGVEDVGLQISKRQSASTFAITTAVKRTVQEINDSHSGVKLDVVYDSSTMILTAINSVTQTLIYGVLLAMLVLFIFFGDWKASLIVGSSIPVSLLVTMIAMSAMGYTFNMLSLGGLVIGVGMMVDSSIVVLESCFRCKSEGRSMMDSAIEGTRLVSSSIIASTLTTVVVFLPITFIKGMAGQLFGQLCFTIVFSLIASLIAALTLVPLVFYRIIPVEKEHKLIHRAMNGIESAYRRFLPHSLAHKKLVVFVSVLLLAVSLAIIPLIGIEMLPASDDGVIELSVSTRPGLKLEKLDEKLRSLEEMIRVHPDVDRYSLSSGGSGMNALTGQGGTDASITAYLKSDRQMETDEVIEQWRTETSEMYDCDIHISASSTTAQMAGGTNIDISLQGTDRPLLEQGARQVEEMMRANPDVLRVTSAVGIGKPQAEIVVDPVKAAAMGLVPAQVMLNVRNLMTGTEAATLHQGGRDYTIRVEYPADRFASIADLAGMSIPNPAGAQIPLLDIASIAYSDSPQQITSQNGRYLLTVSAQPTPTASKKLSQELDAQARTLLLPPGVSITQSASLQRQQEEFSSLYGAILTAVFLVFMVMAMQFESPRFSLVVMLCIPFSLIGSFGLLFITDTTLSLPSLMGFLMLVGIVVNNGILFIDTTNRLRLEDGLSAEEALAQAGTLRMRPIFMTTLTTILAMVPMAVGTGGNAELMRGMALVIIGGLTASTILTLLLLPSFYLLLGRKKKKVKNVKALPQQIS